MKKSGILFVLVLILSVLGLIETLTGFVLWFALPHEGGRQGVEQIFWGLSRNTWVSIHNRVAILLIVVVLIHVFLHWKWIMRMFKTYCPFIGKKV